MAVIADLRRRFGVGWGGVVLYLALFLAGIGVLEALGDLPLGTAGRYPPPQVLVPGLAFGLGLVGVVLAASNLPTYVRLVRAGGADTGAVADGAPGRVVLAGTAETAGGTLTTPFAGTPAVAYTTRVLENSHDDAETARDSEENWSVVHVGEETTRFAVDDGSGPVPVDPADSRLHLADRDREMVAADEELPASAREYFASTGIDADAAGTHLRFEEAALEPGEEAFVLGRADGGTVEATLVAEGDHATRIRGRVVRGGTVGLAVAVAGYLGLLVVAGVP